MSTNHTARTDHELVVTPGGDRTVEAGTTPVDVLAWPSDMAVPFPDEAFH